MKKIIVLGILVILVLFFMFNEKKGNDKLIVQTYPWQINILADGKSSVFGLILGDTSLQEVSAVLKSTPKIALFEANKKMSLEAYYKNVSLGGLTGSFIFTLDVSDKQLNKLKNESYKQKRTKNNGVQYDLDKLASAESKTLIVNNLIYIPAVQLDEKIIIQRFGQPTFKIKLKTKETGWHYLYPEKGLDLIYKEEGKEVLQYVSPAKFNLLLEPLQSH